MRRQTGNDPPDDDACAGKTHGGRFVKRPYRDGRQDASFFMGADGDEIGAGGGIIVVRQPNLFSHGPAHGTPILRRGDS